MKRSHDKAVALGMEWAYLKNNDYSYVMGIDSTLKHVELMNKTPLYHSADTLLRQYQTLLGVSESIVLHRDLKDLLQDLAKRLQGIVCCDYINIILHDPVQNVMRLHLLDTKLSSQIPGFELPIDETPSGWVWQTQQPLVIPDIDQETRFPKIIRMLQNYGVKSACVVPLTTSFRRLGALGLGSISDYPYRETDLEFLMQVGKQVALAVDNVLNYQSNESYQRQLARERDRLRLLLDVNNAVVSTLDLKELFAVTTAKLRGVMQIDLTGLALYDAEKNQMQLFALDFPGNQSLCQIGTICSMDDYPMNEAIKSLKPVLINSIDFENFPQQSREYLIKEGIKCACLIPLTSHGRLLGVLKGASRREDAFTPEDMELLGQVANQIAIAVENALAFRQIADLKNKLSEEKLYLEKEIQIEHNFEEIIGESPSLKHILKEVEIVAPTDSTVLIQGETGTGKELIARAIHNRSGRGERTFVRINCAAIPTGLLESELFGHERGAFTGAITQKIGRFELAHQGTLFLDEIGDIPMELQTKLLRVLQEREFERLGGTRTIRVDVRLVAATNRNLVRMVADNQFRSDLYYRLNVFPIILPPLRERPEDIPMLVRHFAQKYALRMIKRIESIPTETLSVLSKYHWPGNIRELENFIERAVILSKGPTLHVPMAELRLPANAMENSIVTLESAERQHILRVLNETKWIVGGPKGAANRLGMKRTTLLSKMERLGISRPTSRQ